VELTRRARPSGRLQADGSVAERLRHVRTSLGLTQRQLALKACISLEAVWTIENGRKQPRRSTARLLAEALGVDEAWLLAPRRGHAVDG
jgi:transcriptional regulator with XRE-family HTH domain